MPKPQPAANRTVDEGLSLPELCAKASGHVARARLSLHGKDYDAEGALKHLDKAIDCLQRILPKGGATQRPALDRLSA